MKTEAIQSVVHDWLSHLPFTQQAVLFLALRGPDGLPKYSAAKELLYYIRHCVLRPAYPYDKTYTPDGFMRGDFENFGDVENRFFADVDALPHHFLMHVIHAAQIIATGYRCDKSERDADELSFYIRLHFERFYRRACKDFHMNPETVDELSKRLKR